MTKLTITPPSSGEKDSAAEPKVTTALKTVEEWLNGKNIETTDNLKKEGIAEESLSKALQEKLTTRVGLTLKKQKGSIEGVSENLYLMEEAATTLTLPAATLNRFIGITALNGINNVKVTASAGKIFGDFLAPGGETTVTLQENQHILVEADGTNWRIIAGEPKREQAYSAPVARTVGVEYEPSATRPVFVSLRVELEVGKNAYVKVGAVAEVGQMSTSAGGGQTLAYSVLVPAGLKWVVTGVGVTGLMSSYLIL